MKKDEEILKKYFKEEFSDASVKSDMEDVIMNKIEAGSIKVEKPLVSKTIRFIFLSLAILIPVAFVVLSLNGSDVSAFDINTSKLWTIEEIIAAISSGPAFPIVGIIFIYIAFDVLWRHRKRLSKS